MANTQRFLLYRIYYGDDIVYLGRTKQPLKSRLRGHFFQKPMHRTIAIQLVTKVEYAEFQTEADMNLYEIYFILTLKPPLNVDDKTKDYPTVNLPDVEWKVWDDSIFHKWQEILLEKETEYDKDRRRYRSIYEDIRVVKSLWHTGQISEDECYDQIEKLKEEEQLLHKKLYG